MDTLSQFLTRVRNASSAQHYKVDVPSSTTRKGVAEVLKREGYIKDFRVVPDGKQGLMRVYLKYSSDGKPAFVNLERMSRSGRRLYIQTDKIPKIRSGFGTSVLSTSKGILSGNEAQNQKVGGEYLFRIW